jgi:hypothetical protein
VSTLPRFLLCNSPRHELLCARSVSDRIFEEEGHAEEGGLDAGCCRLPSFEVTSLSLRVHPLPLPSPLLLSFETQSLIVFLRFLIVNLPSRAFIRSVRMPVFATHLSLLRLARWCASRTLENIAQCSPQKALPFSFSPSLPFFLPSSTKTKSMSFSQ